MAQAESVPTAIRRLVTGAASKASTRRSADRLYVIGGSAPYVRPIETETSLLELLREITGRPDPANPGEVQNRHWYYPITGRMPPRRYVLAVCYATAAFLLGWYPWNFLLILLLFSSSKHLQVSPIDNPNESDAPCKIRGCR